MDPEYYKRYNQRVTDVFNKNKVHLYATSGITADGMGHLGMYLNHGQAKMLGRKGYAIRPTDMTDLMERYEWQQGLVGGTKRPYTLSRRMQTRYSQKFAPVLRDVIRYNNMQKYLGFAKIIGAPLAGIAVGALAAKGFGWYFRTMIKTVDYINDTVANARSLEIGCAPGMGFLSQEAATERQRMMGELRNSPHSNRRFLGSEASLYAGAL